MRISTVLALIHAKDEINRILWVKSINTETLKNTLIQIAASDDKIDELARMISQLETAISRLIED